MTERRPPLKYVPKWPNAKNGNGRAPNMRDVLETLRRNLGHPDRICVRLFVTDKT